MKNDKTIFQIIIENIRKEFDEFEKKMITEKSPEEVFRECWMISCFTELYKYINDEFEEDFEEEEVEVLVGVQDILHQLYFLWLDSEGYSFNSFEDDKELIQGLIYDIKYSYS